MRLVLLLTVSASPQAATERVKITYIKWKSGGKPGGGKTGEGKVTGGKWSEKWSEKRNKVKCKDVGKVLLMWSSNCLSHTHPTHTHTHPLSHSLTHTRAQSHVKNSVTLLRENWKKQRKEKLKNWKTAKATRFSFCIFRFCYSNDFALGLSQLCHRIRFHTTQGTQVKTLSITITIAIAIAIATAKCMRDALVFVFPAIFSIFAFDIELRNWERSNSGCFLLMQKWKTTCFDSKTFP